jgi:uncharacterized protein YndB with AHSA1/START domain
MSEPTKAVFEIVIRGSIEAVWREITKTDEPQGAIFGMQLHTTGLKPGAAMQMRTANGKYTGMVGEVLEFDPPRRFAHTHKFTQYDDPVCKVIYDLKQEGDHVRFTLTVEGLTPGTKTSKQMVMGGPMITRTLKAIVETGRPTLGTRLLYAMFKLFEPFSPKSTLASNWPLQPNPKR